MILCLEKKRIVPHKIHLAIILPNMDSMGIPKNPPTEIRSRDFVSQTQTPTTLRISRKTLAEAARSVIFASAPGQPSECCVSSFFLSRFWQKKTTTNKLPCCRKNSRSGLLEKLEPAASLSRFYGGIPVFHCAHGLLFARLTPQKSR